MPILEESTPSGAEIIPDTAHGLPPCDGAAVIGIIGFAILDIPAVAGACCGSRRSSGGSGSGCGSRCIAGRACSDRGAGSGIGRMGTRGGRGVFSGTASSCAAGGCGGIVDDGRRCGGKRILYLFVPGPFRGVVVAGKLGVVLFVLLPLFLAHDGFPVCSAPASWVPDPLSEPL